MYRETVLLILWIVYVQCRSHSSNADMLFIKICNETSPISLNTMNTVLINRQLSGEESNEFKCFLHCLFTKYEWMDEDGGFLLTDIREVLEEASLDPILLEFVMYKCTALSSVDRCQRAFQFTECFWEKVHENSKEDENYAYSFDKKMRHFFI